MARKTDGYDPFTAYLRTILAAVYMLRADFRRVLADERERTDTDAADLSARLAVVEAEIASLKKSKKGGRS